METNKISKVMPKSSKKAVDELQEFIKKEKAKSRTQEKEPKVKKSSKKQPKQKSTSRTIPKITIAAPSKTKAGKTEESAAKTHIISDEEMKSIDLEKKQFLETNIDRLVTLVNEKKTITIRSAAKKFKVREDIVEHWGQVLDDSGFIDIHYPTFGLAVLRAKKKGAPKGKGKGKEKQEEKKPRNVMKVYMFVGIVGAAVILIAYLYRNPSLLSSITATVPLPLLLITILLIVSFSLAGLIIVKAHRKRGRLQKTKQKPQKKEKKKEKKQKQQKQKKQSSRKKLRFRFPWKKKKKTTK